MRSGRGKLPENPMATSPNFHAVFFSKPLGSFSGYNEAVSEMNNAEITVELTGAERCPRWLKES